MKKTHTLFLLNTVNKHFDFITESYQFIYLSLIIILLHFNFDIIIIFYNIFENVFKQNIILSKKV